MGISNMTPSKMAGIDLDLGSNRWLELIKLAKENKGISDKKKFELNFRNGKTFRYLLKVYDKEGNEVNCKEEGFKNKFRSEETAKKFIEFYKVLHPEFVYRLQRF